MASISETQKDKWAVLFVWYCEGRNVENADEEGTTGNKWIGFTIM